MRGRGQRAQRLTTREAHAVEMRCEAASCAKFCKGLRIKASMSFTRERTILDIEASMVSPSKVHL